MMMLSLLVLPLFMIISLQNYSVSCRKISAFVAKLQQRRLRYASPHDTVMLSSQQQSNHHQDHDDSTIVERYNDLMTVGEISSSLTSDLVPMPSSSSITSTVTIATSNAAGSMSMVPNTDTFSQLVERGIIKQFGKDATERIIESWRLLDEEYIHDVCIDDNPLLRQYCHSYVRDLTVKPFWDISELTWCKRLQSKYTLIREEFDSVTSDMESLKKQGNNIWTGALTDDASSYGVGWKTLVLMDRGIWDPINVNLFPVTSKLLYDLRIPCCEVFFASMEPHSKIELHSDFTNFVLTCHLPLHIPYSGSNKCRLTVGDTTKQWMNGNLLLFDTSLMHDAINDSDQTRFILMLRVWHPDLTDIERQAIQYTFNCLEHPNLVSNDMHLANEAEHIVKERMKFPYIQRGGISSTGFGVSTINTMSHNNRKKKMKKKYN